MRQGTNWMAMRRYLYFFSCFLAVAPDLTSFLCAKIICFSLCAVIGYVEPTLTC